MRVNGGMGEYSGDRSQGKEGGQVGEDQLELCMCDIGIRKLATLDVNLKKKQQALYQFFKRYSFPINIPIPSAFLS